VQRPGEGDDGDRAGISRVDRPARRARDWYDALSRAYRFVEPFESAAREAGLDLLDAAPGEFALDVGAGAGGALVRLADRVGTAGRVCGVDVAEGMCRVARDRTAARGLGDRVAVVCGDARSLPFARGCFDAAFCSFTLELFDAPDLPRVLGEMRRVLDERGRLVVVSLASRDGETDPLAVRAYERLHEAAPTYLDCRPIPVERVLRDGGFRVERTRTVSTWGLPVTAALVRPAE
jgi:demethylmenaquinone methyltransferase/2-methoxy-6-polyprenyl-1,4-benzoquinol methylase